MYCIFSRFRSCSFGTVRHGCERTVFGSDLDGVRPSFRIRCQRPHVFVCTRSVAHIPTTVQLPVLTCVLWILTVSKLQFRHREARLRTHGFWLGFRWCSAFSHPLPTTSCFCLRRFGCLYTCYGPITCLDLCTVYTVYILTVSKLQIRHRAARLRTRGFRLGFRWCSAFSHPLPTTSCFCLRRFGCLYTCYGPITCLDLCTVYTVYILTVSKLQFRHRAARLRTRGFRLRFRWCSAFSHPLPTTSCFCLSTFGCSYTCYGPLTCLDLCTVYFNGFEAAVSAP